MFIFSPDSTDYVDSPDHVLPCLENEQYIFIVYLIQWYPF